MGTPWPNLKRVKVRRNPYIEKRVGFWVQEILDATYKKGLSGRTIEPDVIGYVQMGPTDKPHIFQMLILLEVKQFAGINEKGEIEFARIPRHLQKFGLLMEYRVNPKKKVH